MIKVLWCIWTMPHQILTWLLKSSFHGNVALFSPNCSKQASIWTVQWHCNWLVNFISNRVQQSHSNGNRHNWNTREILLSLLVVAREARDSLSWQPQPAIDLIHKSHNPPVPYPTMHHSVQKYRHVPISVLNGALWDMELMHCGICEIVLFDDTATVLLWHVQHLWRSNEQKWNYRKVSNIRRTLVGNKIVDHSDVVGASPVGAAPTTSSFST